MILFPNAKVNLGLNIVGRRADGYHDLLTVMIPVQWCDVLEILPADNGATSLTVTGNSVDCPPERNLVMKAYRALAEEVGGIPAAEIRLHKVIPDGAGMGGGSADAAFTLVGLNKEFGLGLDDDRLAAVASRVGADCPFFIYNRPAYCTGIGTDISHDVIPALDGLYIAIAKPQGQSVSTAEAYAGVTPHPATASPRDIVALPAGQWRDALANDFEQSVFARVPRCADLKQHFYDSGALYSAMSGSGSAIFGIFDNDKLAQRAINPLADCHTFTAKLGLE